MISIVAVLSLVFAAAWSAENVEFKLPEYIETILKTPGLQYGLYEKHTAAVKLPRHATKDALLGLDIKRDGSVDENDLKLSYWHKDVEFAVERFFNMINNDKTDRIIDENDLKDDFVKKEYAVALSECKFLKSPGLRQSCYADQLLTYVLLAVGDKDTQEFVNHLSGVEGERQPIPLAKITEKFTSLKDTFKEEKKAKYDIGQTAEELGANYGVEKDVVTYDELDDYISQESILDDFRRCRNKELNDKKLPDFKDDCLTEELFEYTNEDLTDLDIAVLFRLLDKDESDLISEHELKHLPGVKTEVNHRDVLELLDRDGPDDQNVDFAEFRAYLRSPTVLIQLERVCTEKEKEQEDEILCIYRQFTNLALDLHYPIWLEVPDLDQEITFEIFDSNNDGKLEENELKEEFFKEKAPLALTRFIDEIDSDDDNEYICLEEFNEYLDIPHMVYGTADCLLKSRNDKIERGGCFTDETIDIVDNIKYFPEEAFENWFKNFLKNDNKHIDIGDTIEGLAEENKENFLEELGQGSDIVTEFEFTWYVKQQELADRYEDAEKGAGINDELKGEEISKHISTLNGLLFKYIDEDFTELDTVQLFERLDKDDDGELTVDDFDKDITGEMETLLKSIDSKLAEGDEGETVNFLEFWLWLNEPTGNGKEKRKDTWEKDCQKVKKTQSEELKCLVEKFKPEKPKQE